MKAATENVQFLQSNNSDSWYQNNHMKQIIFKEEYRGNI